MRIRLNSFPVWNGNRNRDIYKSSGRNCWAVGSSPWAGLDRLFIEAQPMSPPSHINSVRVRLMHRVPGSLTSVTPNFAPKNAPRASSIQRFSQFMYLIGAYLAAVSHGRVLWPCVMGLHLIGVRHRHTLHGHDLMGISLALPTPRVALAEISTP